MDKKKKSLETEVLFAIVWEISSLQKAGKMYSFSFLGYFKAILCSHIIVQRYKYPRDIIRNYWNLVN